MWLQTAVLLIFSGCAPKGGVVSPVLLDPFEGCQWQPATQTFMCDGLFFSFQTLSESAPTDALVQVTVQGIAAASEDDIAIQAAHLDALPEGVDFFRLQSQRFPREGLIYLNQSEPVNISVCWGMLDQQVVQRCDAMLLAALAGNLPVVETPPPPSDGHLVGPHEMRLFEECQYQEEVDRYQITCPEEVLLWQNFGAVDENFSIDFMWDSVLSVWSGEGVEDFSAEAAQCRFRGVDSEGCRSIHLFITAESKAYTGTIAFFRFGDNGYVLHCFTTRTDDGNLCSLNELHSDAGQ